MRVTNTTGKIKNGKVKRRPVDVTIKNWSLISTSGPHFEVHPGRVVADGAGFVCVPPEQALHSPPGKLVRVALAVEQINSRIHTGLYYIVRGSWHF